MKIITLNIWGGRACKDETEFFKKYSDTDVWCFQEIYHNSNVDYSDKGLNLLSVDHNLFETLSNKINHKEADFCQVLQGRYGIATFLKENIKVLEKGEVFLARGDWTAEPNDERDHHRKMQWFEIEVDGKMMLFMNVHLTHRPKGKMDSEKRLNQSKIICDFMKMFDCPKILVGDFNLLPDTESIKMIEDVGMSNLIKEYKISSTRTKLYEKPLPFADYIFVSKEINVKDFKVLPDVISDHSPLYLEIE